MSLPLLEPKAGAMRVALFFALTLLVPAVAIAQGAPKAEPTQAIAAAGADVGKLLQLARDWSDGKRTDAARAAWKRVIAIDPDNATARAGLNHQRYDGRWFEGHTALFDYKRAEDERKAKQGLARLGESWVPVADAPFLRLGWHKDQGGAWIHPLAKLRLDRERDLAGKGFQQQDLEWIDPRDFDQWQAGLWKCGEQWLDTAAANAFHADVAHSWLVASEHFIVSTTVERDRIEWCKYYADQAFADLVRIFGIAPGARSSAIDLQGCKGDQPELVVFSSLAQYNKFANLGIESEGFSSLHYAFFADAAFDDAVKPSVFAGLGVAVWDNSSKTLDGFGQHSIRHAAAQSFIEAIDPSWKALGDMATGAQTRSTLAFWAEKKVPRWLRYGAASYVERWFLDATTGDQGNPRWARDWAKAQLKKDGGLRDLQKVFDFRLTLTDLPGSTQLIHEAGLLVAFLLEGSDQRVQRAHQTFQAALRSGGATAPAVAELQKALLAARPAVMKFAGS